MVGEKAKLYYPNDQRIEKAASFNFWSFDQKKAQILSKFQLINMKENNKDQQTFISKIIET